MSGKQAGRIACKACIGIRYTVRVYRVSNQLVTHRKRSSRPIKQGRHENQLVPSRGDTILKREGSSRPIKQRRGKNDLYPLGVIRFSRKPFCLKS